PLGVLALLLDLVESLCQLCSFRVDFVDAPVEALLGLAHAALDQRARLGADCVELASQGGGIAALLLGDHLLDSSPHPFDLFVQASAGAIGSDLGRIGVTGHGPNARGGSGQNAGRAAVQRPYMASELRHVRRGLPFEREEAEAADRKFVAVAEAS